jgi:hypothetical protein
VVTLQGLSFSPSQLTINVGETVQWINQGGSHNVNGSQQSYPNNPASFGSGSVLPAPWTYSHTFNTPGFYQYHCDPHFSAGMTGTITVLGPGFSGDVVITEIMYNNPGTDSYEFIELYNRGTTAVDLENWSVSGAINHTFSPYSLAPQSYLVLALNKDLFDAAFGTNSIDWNEGSNTNVLNNTGETIILQDANGILVDSVAYSDSSPWPTEADGQGSSLVLCDVNGDNNDPANWAAAITPTGFSVSGVEILANPESASACPTGALISFVNTTLTLLENAGNVFVRVAIAGGGPDPATVMLALESSSTAIPGSDFNLSLPLMLTFPAGVANDTITVELQILDDAEVEPTEAVVLHLMDPSSGTSISPGNSMFSLNILDNDASISSAMVITGVFDAQVQSGGTWAKGAELQAVQDIPDLSIYGIGFANNGGGTDGIEVPLPAISLSAGECIWVANDSTLFFNFFGFYPTFTATAAGINGDDAIELFENNLVIDVFGEITHSGGNLPWAYTDGWAYRQSGTGPDGSVFALDNWNFSGVDAFDLVPNNTVAPSPFPVCTYSVVPPVTAIAIDDFANTDYETPVTINVLNNDILPNPASTTFSLSDPPANGFVSQELLLLIYTPNPGFCGTDEFSYTVCDALGCDEGTVTVVVSCPVSYPVKTIAEVTTVNNNGQPNALGQTCQLQGIVYGIDYRGGNGLQFTLIDNTGGINVFSASKEFGYTVVEGDELVVRGKIDQYSCLTEMIPDTIWVVSTGNDLEDPAITTFLNESFESELVELTNLTLVDPADWTGTGSGFNVRVTNGTFTNIMRIDNDCELYSMPAPSGPFHAIGIAGQFDTAPCDDGYQFFPRYAADIIPLDNALERLREDVVRLFPNPVSGSLFIESELWFEELWLRSALGQLILQTEVKGNTVDLSAIAPGMYFVSLRTGNKVVNSRVIKQ